MASPDRSDSKGVNSSHADEKRAAPDRGDGNKKAPAARAGMTRLPKMEVLNILARDPRSIDSQGDVEPLRKLVREAGRQVPEEVLRFVAQSYSEGMREKFIVFQNWVYEELERNGYVEVPDQFISDREDARRRKGGHIDQYLPDRYFTTVVGDDGEDKLVFSFTGKEEKAVPESNSSDKDNIFLSYSAKLEPEMKVACGKGVEPSHAAGKKKKPAAAAASVGGNTEKAPATGEGMTRVPEWEVVNILSRDPTSIAPGNVEALRMLALQHRPGVPEEVLRVVAESFNEQMTEQFVAFQDWVLAELDEKGYVEVPDELIKTDEASKQQGEQIDLYLSCRHFTTVVDDDDSERLVFSYKKKEEVDPESKSNQDSIFLSFSAEVEPEIKAAFHMLLESSEDEEWSDEDEDEEEGDSKESDD